MAPCRAAVIVDLALTLKLAEHFVPGVPHSREAEGTEFREGYDSCEYFDRVTHVFSLSCQRNAEKRNGQELPTYVTKEDRGHLRKTHFVCTAIRTLKGDGTFPRELVFSSS